MTIVRSNSPEAKYAWRTRNVGYLLSAATGQCIADKLRVIHDRGFSGTSEAQMALFNNLGASGERLTSLAARAGLTKQSMIELVDRAEALALVERCPDVSDKRAKIVRLTPKGHLLIAALHEGVNQAEQRMVRAIGEAFFEMLKGQLSTYAGLSLLDDDARGTSTSGSADMSWRLTNIGRVLSMAARQFVTDVLGSVRARGNLQVTEIMLPLLRNLDLEGARLTDLASRARMTKQSMREIVDQVEALGFVTRAPDRSDKRAKSIQFTAAGLVLLDEMGLGVADAEARFIQITGEKFVAEMKAHLRDYIALPLEAAA